MTRLDELASTIRSKNAGVDHITFDILFKNRDDYERVCASGVISKGSIAILYGIAEADVTHFVEFPPANAIKFTLVRSVAHGSLRDADVYGSQQYAPLLAIEVP